MNFSFFLPSAESLAPVAAESNLPGRVDHLAVARFKVPWQFQGKQNYTAIVEACAKQAQDLEDSIWALLDTLNLSESTGVYLRRLSAIVGLSAFDGLSDATLRRFVRAKIQANRSNGLPETILAITKIVLDDPSATVRLQNTGQASYLIDVTNADGYPYVGADVDAIISAVGLFLGIATSAGVLAQVRFNASPSSDVFKLAGGNFLTANASIGQTVLQVSDASKLPVSGSVKLDGSSALVYTSRTRTTVTLAAPLSVAYPQNTSVALVGLGFSPVASPTNGGKFRSAILVA